MWHIADLALLAADVRYQGGYCCKSRKSISHELDQSHDGAIASMSQDTVVPLKPEAALLMSKKSARPVPVIAVEIRSPCAISFNHSQYVAHLALAAGHR